jgi:hypothetical protein
MSECKNYVSIYLNCMKINNTSHTKCKTEFENLYKCFNLIK